MVLVSTEVPWLTIPADYSAPRPRKEKYFLADYVPILHRIATLKNIQWMQISSLLFVDCEAVKFAAKKFAWDIIARASYFLAIRA